MSASQGVGETVLMLADSLASSNTLYLADDEQEGEAVAAALSAMMPNNPIVFVPCSDTLPGDHTPASPANIGRRVAALRRLRHIAQHSTSAHSAVIMSGEAAARRYADPAAFDAALPILRQGDAIDVASFAAEMEALGYVADDRVDEPGEVAVRGHVVDIFPADAGQPARIDVVNGRIAGIRRYNPATQLTDEPCDSLEIGRASEPQSTVTVSILAHLTPGRLIQSPKAEKRRQRFVRLARQAAGAGTDVDAITSELWTKELASWDQGVLQSETSTVPRFAEQKVPMSALKRFAAPLVQAGQRLLLVGSHRDIRFLRPKLGKAFKSQVTTVAALQEVENLPAGVIGALVAPIDRGAAAPGMVMIAAADLLGTRAIIDDLSDNAESLQLASGEIRTGDLVVHESHGVGRVLGLEPAPDDSGSELIALEYAGESRRLVPVYEAGRLWRYGADGDAIRLDKLDGSSWKKRRATIDEAISESAHALLSLARERDQLKAPVIEPDPADYERFVATFAFNETADQARAIQTVRDDLASGRPMDRLIIGDVGYGKTEVALRASALAALAGYQVVIAAPTTVLVRQHLHTFQRRFAETGIRIAELSRLSGAAEKRATKSGLADGSISIVVGTAAAMAKNVNYFRLGLVIIDEEQRFGAADKAQLRNHPETHLLAMSATPIPRTLHRAMIGLQQISIIASPPARRQPIRTSLAQPDDAMIRTALLRERSRGGQSFVVVPRIKDLGPLAERLGRIVPNLALIEAHGKMRAADIDEAMVRFADGDGDVLLTTNIIEAGLDVPRANTMIVWRADRFGLAQLHQLRGRVGRGNRRGQVILLTEGEEIAERTMKRLRTLATFDRLGAGFEISVADLDQRGAGDPLADTQAGHMKLIGVDLYQHLFETALRQAQGQEPALRMPDLNLGDTGTLPVEWIPDPNIRLGLYLRMAHLADEASLDLLEEELTDRFGRPPAPVEQLLAVTRISILSRMAGIERVDAGPAAIALTPRRPDHPTPEGITFSVKNGRWLFKELTGEHDRLARIIDLLETLISAEK